MADIPQTTLQPAWLQDKAVVALSRLFSKGTLRFVGGCVRNTLLDVPITDIDVATTVTPDEVLELALKNGVRSIPTGLQHGTVTLVLEGGSFEVTTLRRDEETDGRHAKVSYSTSWKEDAARRDFTMNALYLDPDGQLYDYFGGMQDLEKRLVRFIGDASERIQEDKLRVLRFFRFAGQYGAGPLDGASLAAIKQADEPVRDLSAERIDAECMKLFGVRAGRLGDMVQAMLNCGISPANLIVDGSAERMRETADMDALDGHQIMGTPISLIRLSLLARHAGLDHKNVASALRLSRKEHRFLESVERAVRSLQNGETTRQAAYRFGIAGAYAAGWCENERGDASLADFQVPVFPLTATDLMQAGIEKGPEMGRRLKAAEDAFIMSNFTLTSEALLALALRPA